jgi:hypothetical protein
MSKFKVGDTVRCVVNGEAFKPKALGYKPDKEFVVDFIRRHIDGDIYFPKDEHGVQECDLILVKKDMKDLIGRKVKGFRFNHEVIHYGSHMDKYIDQEGTIVSYDSYGPGYTVIFDVYSRYTYPAELIEKYLIEITKEVIKTIEITRTQLKEIHDVACNSWKSKIQTYTLRNPFKNTIEFTQSEVDEMFKAATLDQTPVLEGIFGKQIEDIDLSKGTVDSNVLFDTNGDLTNTLITVRRFYEFTNKAFILNDVYNWELVKDSKGVTCLIPTRK